MDVLLSTRDVTLEVRVPKLRPSNDYLLQLPVPCAPSQTAWLTIQPSNLPTRWQMSAELAFAQQSGQAVEKQLSEARATMEKYLRDYDTLFNRTQKLTEDLEDQVQPGTI